MFHILLITFCTRTFRELYYGCCYIFEVSKGSTPFPPYTCVFTPVLQTGRTAEANNDSNVRCY